ncbi:cysteine desulfurase SufS [Candidatus Palibaumannia cicadellinicola]|uniref:Cysteine desulfurase n=1 Tax=Candidatus Palibaumannia cicadellinicola TaxID=186490 RepID=A0A0K2BLS2_9GAMM|nr:cysteine desulfurase SufS [Candidatus Baumannia cicadellinicola]AKZ65998.1 Cysteine desulfurase, SufS subfamily [Candidatus Baumannia cicadellinicola]
MTYPIDKIRAEFPILYKRINGYPLTYLDSAASSQKPNSVINCEMNFYRQEYAAVHRGIHTLSSKATVRMEQVRTQVANFINAASEKEIVFVKGATEGINLVANSWGKYQLQKDDNIVITEMEHHANIVPWQMLAQDKQITLRVIPLQPDGTLNLSRLSLLINERTKLVAVTQVSNVLGTVNPISNIITKIRSLSNALVLVDGAQSAMHHKVDVKSLDCDFYVFSGHKIYGPSGIGILYVKKNILDTMPPWEGGGSMIHTVSLIEGTTFNEPPWCFEAGSPNIAGIIGLGAAIDYIQKIGLNNISNWETDLMHYAISSLQEVPKFTLYGLNKRTGVISFNLGKHHAYDVGSLLDQYGIAIRTGHHCAMPLMTYFKVPSMCRASLAMYSIREEVDRLVIALVRIKNILN